MRIFLAWSGDASKRVAEMLRTWLPDVIQSAQPFMSSEDIRKGQRWFNEIGMQLEKAQFAILCLTPTNLDSQWMHFEAGAVSKNIDKSRVTAALLAVTPTDLALPLSQFQHTPLSESEVLKLVLAIDEQLGEQRLGEERVRRAFKRCWPEAQAGIQQAMAVLASERQGRATPTRTQGEILTSLLEVQIGMMKRLESIEETISNLRLDSMTGRAALFGGLGESALGRGGLLIRSKNSLLDLVGEAASSTAESTGDPARGPPGPKT